MKLPRRLILLLGLATVGGVLASLVWREALEKSIVLPILTALRDVSRTWQSLDPEAIWVIFLALAITITLLELPANKHQKAPPAEGPEKLTSGRVSFWWTELQHLYRQSMLTRYSIIELRKLVLDAVAFRQQCSLHQAEEWISEPTNLVPPAIKELFNPNMPPGSALITEGELSGWRRLLGYRQPATKKIESQNEARVEVILKFLEKELKTNYDDPVI